MKRIISLALSAVLLVSCFCIPASAISLTRGKTRLREQFLDGVASNGMDYVYFTPEKVVKGKAGSTRYPLVVWLHGQSSGDTPRAQIENYRFCNWASDEYQARFANAGGAYLLLPRSNASDNSWSNSMCGTLKAVIDEYISQNAEHIDASRIYIAGYSAGGSMVWNMLEKYPAFFAAGIPICSISQPTGSGMDLLTDVSVWLFCCDQDYYPTARTSMAVLTYNYLSNRTMRARGVRMTNVTEAIWSNETVSGGEKAQHYIWGTVTNDMHMNNGDPYWFATTRDAAGRTISFEDENEGVISWLSTQKRTSTSQPDTETKSFFEKLWDKIIELLRKLFFPGIK